MGRRRKQSGVCRLCGEFGPLSYEHVPPEAAFNNGRSYYTARLEEVFRLGDRDFDFMSLRQSGIAKKMQGGVGFYTLCESCNNSTGSWYGSAFVDWIFQGMSILLKANRNPTLIYPTFIYPLRVIKQIVTMFFSVCSDKFGDANPYLRRFVLNREVLNLPQRYRILCYYNIEGVNRYQSETVIGDFESSENIVVAEISFPPMGFVLTLNSQSPDRRLTDISHFADYRYSDWIDHYQQFATLPTHLPFPGDYRTREEIQEAKKQSRESMDGG